jgi:hypothetical protein
VLVLVAAVITALVPAAAARAGTAD